MRASCTGLLRLSDMPPAIDVHTGIDEVYTRYDESSAQFDRIRKKYAGVFSRFKKNLDATDVSALEGIVKNVLVPLSMAPVVDKTCIADRIDLFAASILVFLGKYENTNAAYVRLQELLEDK